MAAGGHLAVRLTVGVRPRTRGLTPVRHGPTLALTPPTVSCLPRVPNAAHAQEPADVARPPFPSDAHRRPHAQLPLSPSFWLSRVRMPACRSAEEDTRRWPRGSGFSAFSIQSRHVATQSLRHTPFARPHDQLLGFKFKVHGWRALGGPGAHGCGDG